MRGAKRLEPCSAAGQGPDDRAGDRPGRARRGAPAKLGSASARRGADPARPGRVAFLYEDADIVVVDKPAGLPTIAPDGSRTKSLLDIVTIHIRKRNPKGRAALVHRLDRDTSGVIVFAKHARAKAALMSGWNDAVDERLYVAVVEGRPPEDEGKVESWLDGSDPYRVRVARPGQAGALRAVTRYRVLASGAGHSLVELSLETGRRHQIRVQMASLGCPVAGDVRYGARTDPLGRLCLHAITISLSPPGGGPIRIESPPPEGFSRVVERGGADTPRAVKKRGRSECETPREPGVGRQAAGHPAGGRYTASGRNPSGGRHPSNGRPAGRRRPG